jgi:transglutaminase-like putative cysteine protease
MLAHGGVARPTERLYAFIQQHRLSRGGDPLSTVRNLSEQIHDAFDYDTEATEVDSPIDHTLEMGRGVCQDFSHIFIACARLIGIPARYVSGYLHHREDGDQRSSPAATHSWVETFIPSLGWVGFDPTNGMLAGERHIRVAVGRDYNDVPPTRGVFKGKPESELAYAVSVSPADAPLRPGEILKIVVPLLIPASDESELLQLQQQQ